MYSKFVSRFNILYIFTSTSFQKYGYIWKYYFKDSIFDVLSILFFYHYLTTFILFISFVLLFYRIYLYLTYINIFRDLNLTIFNSTSVLSIHRSFLFVSIEQCPTVAGQEQAKVYRLSEGDQISLGTFLTECDYAYNMTSGDNRYRIVIHIKNKLKSRAAQLNNSCNPAS